MLYNKEDVFEENIRKKAEDLNELCKSFGVSSFMTFCLKDDGKHTRYQNYVCGSTSNGIRLSDDQIGKHINVANGFATIPQENTQDLDAYFFED